MAHGDTLYVWEATAGKPPDPADTDAGNGAVPQFALRRGFVHLAFDDTIREYIDFHGLLPSSYQATTGVTVRIYWSSANTAADGSPPPALESAAWRAGFRRVELDIDDIDSDHVYDTNPNTTTEGSVSGEIVSTAISFTNGADMDNVAKGDNFVLRASREAMLASDTLVGDAELHKVELEET